MKPAILLGVTKVAAATQPVTRTASARKVAGPVTMETPAAAPAPTVEMIRGDKRVTEVVR